MNEKQTALCILRVSTAEQTGKGQEAICGQYAKRTETEITETIKITGNANAASTRKTIIGAIQNKGMPKILIVSELSRLGRTVRGILEIIQIAKDNGIAIHEAGKGRIVGDGIDSTISTTVMALVAEIEHALIKERTTDTMTHIREEIKRTGFYITSTGRRITKLGRPNGAKTAPKILKKRGSLIRMRMQGLTDGQIARIVKSDVRTIKRAFKHIADEA